MENIGEKIMQARKTKGMTQDTLAQLVNVSRQTVSHWENGRAMPDVATAAQLSKVLDVNFLADEAAEDAAVQPPEAMPTVQEPVQETQEQTDGRFVNPPVLPAAVCSAVPVAALLRMSVLRLGSSVPVPLQTSVLPVHLHSTVPVLMSVLSVLSSSSAGLSAALCSSGAVPLQQHLPAVSPAFSVQLSPVLSHSAVPVSVMPSLTVLVLSDAVLSAALYSAAPASATLPFSPLILP